MIHGIAMWNTTLLSQFCAFLIKLICRWSVMYDNGET